MMVCVARMSDRIFDFMFKLKMRFTSMTLRERTLEYFRRSPSDFIHRKILRMKVCVIKYEGNLKCKNILLRCSEFLKNKIS